MKRTAEGTLPPAASTSRQHRPILAPDLHGPGEDRWPALAQAFLGHGIQAVFAMSVAVAGTPIGAALRTYARDHNIKLTELSRALVNRAVPAALVLDHARTRDARAV